MSKVALTGNASGTGTITLASPNTNTSTTYTLPSADGTSGQFLQTNGSGALSFATVSAGLTLGTPVATTSGTTAEITGIPSGVKQINVTFGAIQFTGSGTIPSMEVSTSSAYLTSGYTGRRVTLRTTGVTTVTMSSNIVLGDGNYYINPDYMSGSLIMTLLNSSTNTWTGTSSLAVTGSNNVLFLSTFIFSLSGEINKLKIYDALGNSFAGGQFNIAYF